MKRLILSLAVLFSMFFLAENSKAQYISGSIPPCGDPNNSIKWSTVNYNTFTYGNCIYTYEFYFRKHNIYDWEFSITFWTQTDSECETDDAEILNRIYIDLMWKNSIFKPWIEAGASKLILSSSAQCYTRRIGTYEAPIKIGLPGDPSSLTKSNSSHILDFDTTWNTVDYLWWPCTSLCCHALNEVTWTESGNLQQIGKGQLIGKEPENCKECYGICDKLIHSFATKRSIDELKNSENSCLITPNPSNGKFNLILNSETKGLVTFTIRNAVGDIIFKEDVQKSNLLFEKEITIENAASGSYFYSIDIDGIPNSSGTVVIIK